MEINSIIGLDGVKGVMFDCYKTLVDISTDESSVRTYEPLSRWLSYHGVKLSPENLMKEYKRLCKEAIEGRWERHSEIKVEDIFARICRERATWPINDITVGIEAAPGIQVLVYQEAPGVSSKH